MASKTIPQKVVYTCDRCGATGEHYGKGPFCDYAELSISFGGRAIDGSTGGGHSRYDLCGDCYDELLKFLQAAQRREG